MKITRRSLLSLIGLGAVAAALPATSAHAAEPELTAGPYWGNSGITPPDQMLSNLPLGPNEFGDYAYQPSDKDFHDGWKAGYKYGTEEEPRGMYPGDWGDGYTLGRENGKAEAELMSAPTAIVVGALFDFMGYLTTRDQPLTLSGHHEPNDLITLYKEWATLRGLDPYEADVQGWQSRLTTSTTDQGQALEWQPETEASLAAAKLRVEGKVTTSGALTLAHLDELMQRVPFFP